MDSKAEWANVTIAIGNSFELTKNRYIDTFMILFYLIHSVVLFNEIYANSIHLLFFISAKQSQPSFIEHNSVPRIPLF